MVLAKLLMNQTALIQVGYFLILDNVHKKGEGGLMIPACKIFINNLPNFIEIITQGIYLFSTCAFLFQEKSSTSTTTSTT